MPRNHEFYFGFEMTFTDKNGEEHKDAFWKLENLQIDTSRRELTIAFAAWHSAEAFDAGEDSLINNGGYRAYSFSSNGYDNLILKYGQTIAGVAAASKSIAESVKDIPSDGEFESFFANAGDTILPKSFK